MFKIRVSFTLPFPNYMLMTPAVFKPSEFTIINTDGHSDFDIEHNLTLRDQSDRTLDLKLNYVFVPIRIHVSTTFLT